MLFSVVTAHQQTAEEDSDYINFSPSATVLFGDGDEEKTVSLEIKDDEIWEHTEEVVISMAFQSESDAMDDGHYMGQLDKTTLNIIDDDAPGMSEETCLYNVTHSH